MARSFTENEVEPQAIGHDEREEFNHALFREVGSLGLLGITAPVEFGGSGMVRAGLFVVCEMSRVPTARLLAQDATAAVIAHEELSASDPALCLPYLAHSMLFANNLAVNGNGLTSPTRTLTARPPRRANDAA